jgi:hypothetical protein
MFDQFDTIAGSEAGASLHLESPATGSYAYVADAKGQPDLNRPMLIDLLGPDADEYRAKTRKRSAKVIKQRAGKMDIKKMAETQVEAFVLEGEASTLMDAVDATIGWSEMTIDGEPVKYSQENAIRLYTRYPEILRQVTAFIKEAANFLQKA